MPYGACAGNAINASDKVLRLACGRNTVLILTSYFSDLAECIEIE